jgi:hypothetical protein
MNSHRSLDTGAYVHSSIARKVSGCMAASATPSAAQYQKNLPANSRGIRSRLCDLKSLIPCGSPLCLNCSACAACAKSKKVVDVLTRCSLTRLPATSMQPVSLRQVVRSSQEELRQMRQALSCTLPREGHRLRTNSPTIQNLACNDCRVVTPISESSTALLRSLPRRLLRATPAGPAESGLNS